MNSNNYKYLTTQSRPGRDLTRSEFSLLLILFVSIFAWTTPAVAGILTIETQTTVEVAGDLLKVSVTFTNKGTAPAYNLQVHLNTLGKQDDSQVKPQLDSGQSDKSFFERSVAGIGKGRYPLTVRVDFHDANQYPFSALSGMTFHIGGDVNPGLIVQTKDITLKKSGVLQFNIKNLGFEPKKILATLILPKEFSTPQAENSVDIDQRVEKTVDFEIGNFSALPGANYPIFCYFEYDSEDTHHTALARSLVTVGKDENLFRRFRWVWFTLAAILAALLIVVLIRDRRKKSRGQNESDLPQR